jgi:transcriptional regulator with XRE-family HTH domain
LCRKEASGTLLLEAFFVLGGFSGDTTIEPASYSKNESGENRMPYEVMFKLADYFEITIDELLGHMPKNGRIDRKTLVIIHKMKE